MKKNSKFDMYDYIGKDRTMYDIIDRYLILNDSVGKIDYSTPTLVKRMKSYFSRHDTSESTLKIHLNSYVRIVEKLLDNLEYSLNPENTPNEVVTHIMTNEEKAQLLNNLQGTSESEKMNFNSIEEYISYLRKTPLEMDDPYYVKNTISGNLIDASLGVIAKDEEESLRSHLISVAYMPYMMNELKKRYPDRDTNPSDEYDEAKFILDTFSVPAKTMEYDEFIERYERKIAEDNERAAFNTMCYSKRSRKVKEGIVNGLDDGQLEQAQKEGLNTVLFGDSSYVLPTEGSFNVNLNMFDKPKVILDEMAEYSKGGNENQRVIAVSYGTLEYETLFNENGDPTVSSNADELLGITRIGKDKSSTYFVIGQFDTASVKTSNEMQDDDKEIEIFSNGVKVNLFDCKTGEGVHLVKKERIPDDLKDFYSTVAFSDEFLSNAINENSRFAGFVTRYQGIPEIRASYMSSPYDIEALKYAQKYPIQVGDREYYSLESLLRSSEFLASHLNIVKGITNKEYIEVKEDKDKGSAEKPEGPEF